MVTKKNNEMPVKDQRLPELQGIDNLQIEIRKRRDELGLTISELHRATGIARTTLHDYESGKYKPGAIEIRKLCEALKISPNQLLFGKEDFFKEPTSIEKMTGRSPEVKRVKLMTLVSLLPQEEVDAFYSLAWGLISARYSSEIIQKHMDRTDMMMGMLNIIADMHINKDAPITEERVENLIREVSPDLVSEERAAKVREQKKNQS